MVHHSGQVADCLGFLFQTWAAYARTRLKLSCSVSGVLNKGGDYHLIRGLQHRSLILVTSDGSSLIFQLED